MLFGAEVYYSRETRICQRLMVVMCPKCGSQMFEDKHLQALGSEVELVSTDVFLGDKLKVFYCEKCGYIESYRDKNRRP